MLGRGQRSATGIVGEASQLSLDPAHDDGDDVDLMLVCQRVVLDDAVVLREASAATGRRRVLSQEVWAPVLSLVIRYDVFDHRVTNVAH